MNGFEDGDRHLAGTMRQAEARQGVDETEVSPLVAIGMTLRNRAGYLAEAVDSLLAQSHTRFDLVMVDDGSTDETEAVAKAYERRDARIRYVRFSERRGLVAAWRAAFEHASVSGAPYFAWASDHDRWHQGWLKTLVDTLQQYPDVVLAYPLTQRIDPHGAPLAKPARQFETFGERDRHVRWRMFSHSDAVAAGDMVYGLMRSAAVREAGIFREVLCPDRLLLAELTLRGQIRQVPEVLWYRRQFAEGSVERQRSTLFAPGVHPPSALTPPWYLHATSLWATYGRQPNATVAMAPATARRLIATYAAAYAWRHYGKTSVQRGLLSVLGWPRWVYKRAKHGALLGAYGVLVTARHIGLTPLGERLYERVTGHPRRPASGAGQTSRSRSTAAGNWRGHA